MMATTFNVQQAIRTIGTRPILTPVHSAPPGFHGKAGHVFLNTLDATIDWYKRSGMLATANRGIIPDGAFRHWGTSSRRAPGAGRRYAITFLLGTFAGESVAGADAFAVALVRRLTRERSRLGLDGVLASAIIHLKSRGNRAAADGEALWRATPNTAGGLGVIHDRRSGRVFALGDDHFTPDTGLFGRGVELSKEAQDLATGRGQEVMDVCGGIAKVGGAVVGGAIGWKVGGKEGAKKGAEIGVGVGEVVGDFVCGWITEDKPEVHEFPVEIDGHGGAGPGETPTTPIDTRPMGPGDEEPGGMSRDEEPGGQSKEGPVQSVDPGHESQPEQDTQSGNGDDGDHHDPDGGDSGGWPNPEEGYPAPDDGGGSPWSVIGVSALPTIADIAHLGMARGAGVLDLAPALNAMHAQVMDPAGRISIVANLGRLLNGRMTLDPHAALPGAGAISAGVTHG